jgi:general secretion pathway protein F
MARFRYKAVAANGEHLQGELDATSREDAIARVQAAGHLPVSAEAVSGRGTDFRSWAQQLVKPRSVRPREVVLLTSELATLLGAGMPLNNALITLRDLSPIGPVKSLVSAIQERVQGGASLSEAMAGHEGTFGRLYLSLVRAGEASGALDVVMERLAAYLEDARALRSSIQTALIYPTLLLMLVVVSLIVLMTFVIPRFVPLFEDYGRNLPLLTIVVFAVSEWCQTWWWLFPVSIVALAWAAFRLLEDPARRLRWDAWCLGLPWVGPLLAEMEIARFARTLGTLLANGVPMLAAMNLVKDVIGNRTIATDLEAVAASLERGQRMAQPLKASGHFPPLAVELISVGEESGEIDAMLAKLSDIYDEAVGVSVKRLLTVLEPVLILGLGVLVAIIIISVLSAILSLNEFI